MMKRNSIFLCTALFVCQVTSVYAMEGSYLTSHSYPAIEAFCFGVPIAVNLLKQCAVNIREGDDITYKLNDAAIVGGLAGILYCASYGLTKMSMRGKPLSGIGKLGVIFSTPILGFMFLGAVTNKNALKGAKDAIMDGIVTGTGTCALAWALSQRGLLK